MDPGSGELAALADISEFTQLDIEAVLDVLLRQADEDSVAEAVCAGGGRRKTRLRSWSAWDEGVEGAPVAVGPRGIQAMKSRAARVARVNAAGSGLLLPTLSRKARKDGAPGEAGALRRIQRPQTGRKRSSVELERAMRAQRSPKGIQRRADCGFEAGVGSPISRMRRARTSTAAKRKVESEVSHTQRMAYCMAAG